MIIKAKIMKSLPRQTIEVMKLPNSLDNFHIFYVMVIIIMEI